MIRIQTSNVVKPVDVQWNRNTSIRYKEVRPAVTQGLKCMCTDNGIWYFGYGANMDPRVLKRREVKPLEVRNAIAPGYFLTFDHRGAYGNIAPIPDAEDDDDNAPSLDDTKHPLIPPPRTVHGVLLRVTKDDMERLKTFEGGYELSEMEVMSYDGERINATVFTSSPSLRLVAGGQPPMERYLTKLQKGAKHLELDPDYIEFLDTYPMNSRLLGKEYFATPLQARIQTSMTVAGICAGIASFAALFLRS